VPCSASFAWLRFLLHPAVLSSHRQAVPYRKALAHPAARYAQEGSSASTLNNLMADWAERFEAIHPGVKFSLVGGGSSSAVAFVCAQQGQEMAARNGAVALTKALAREECLSKID
jgi:ABC-type phosphate transport system substrate-binding protein